MSINNELRLLIINFYQISDKRFKLKQTYNTFKCIIDESTNFLPKKSHYKERLKYYFENKTDRVRCLYCNEFVKYHSASSFKHDIPLFCSHLCSTSSNYRKEKIIKTNIERYGVSNPFQSEEIKEKIKHTNLKKYDAENPQQNKEIKEKTNNTIFRKYGVKNISQSEQIKQKKINTCLKNYGVKYPGQTQQSIDKVKERILTFEQTVEQFRNVHGDIYQYDDPTYIDCTTKMRMICSKHGEFWQTPNNHKNNQGCPECHINESKGVKYITNFLIDNNINFIKEYRFTDCRYKKTLPFDFYLPDHNICIEYDGEQHFEFVEYLHRTKDEFIECQLRDKIKNNYCFVNKIRLIRIRYNQNINDILSEIFNT